MPSESGQGRPPSGRRRGGFRRCRGGGRRAGPGCVRRGCFRRSRRRTASGSDRRPGKPELTLRATTSPPLRRLRGRHKAVAAGRLGLGDVGLRHRALLLRPVACLSLPLDLLLRPSSSEPRGPPLASIPRNLLTAPWIALRRRVDVARPEFGREVDLLDRRVARGDEQLHHLQHRLRVADVGRRVLGEDVDQVVLAEHQVLEIGTRSRAALRKSCWRAERTMSVSVWR